MDGKGVFKTKIMSIILALNEITNWHGKCSLELSCRISSRLLNIRYF